MKLARIAAYGPAKKFNSSRLARRNVLAVQGSPDYISIPLYLGNEQVGLAYVKKSTAREAHHWDRLSTARIRQLIKEIKREVKVSTDLQLVPKQH